MAASQILRNVSCKKFHDIPGPKSYPLIGTLYKYLPYVGEYDFQRLHHSGMLKYKHYGKLVREEIIPGVQLLYLYDPVHIETMFRLEGRYPFRRSHTALEKIRKDTPHLHNSAGLLPTNGVQWGTMRGQYQQALSRENVQSFITQTDEIAAEFVQHINEPFVKSSSAAAPSSSTDHQRDYLPALMSVFLEMIGSNLFSVRFNALSSVGKSDSLAQRLIKAAEEVNKSTVKADNGLRLWHWIDTPLYKSIKRNIGLLESVSREIVLSRINNKEHSSCSTEAVKPSLLTHWIAQGLAENDIRDVVTMSADLVLAAIDTSAFSTGFILYHLARHQREQDKLHEELKQLLRTCDTPVTLETLAQAAFLKRVVKESLRLNPISIGIGRILTQNGVIGGHEIPAGTVIVTQNQVTCRLAEYFEKPNHFIPDRWDPTERIKSRPHPYTMIPFGHGPRACIGRRLAEQNIYVVLAKLIRRFRVEWEGRKDLDCISHTINKPDAPLQFKFTPRSE